MIKKCSYCSIEFTPKNPKGIYCSDKCRVYGNRLKKGAVVFENGVVSLPKDNSVTKAILAIIEPLPAAPKYNFTGEKFLVIEKYTQYPMAQKPTNPIDAKIWLGKKKIADQEIKEAWDSRMG